MIKNRKAAIGFIFITLLIDVTGLGLIIPVVPKLIEDLLHTSNISSGIIWRVAYFLICDHAIFICTSSWKFK
jgi:hypothetical protein